MSSLIIPTYNRGHLINQTLEAALSQVKKFEEIVVVDDGSTDNTPVIIKPYLKYIKYIQTPNEGVQAARNTAVQHTTTDCLVFCDSDDLLDRDYNHVVCDWLQKHPEIDVTYTNFSTFGARPFYPDKFFAAPEGFFNDIELLDNFYINDSDLYIKSIRYPHMWVTGMAIKKGFYQRIGGFDTTFRGVITEDWEFNLRAVSLGNVARYRHPLARVRYHSGSQSDNTVRTHLGAAKVLEHALNNHQAAKRYGTEIKQHITEHIHKAFNAAYAEGSFDKARLALLSPHMKLKGRRFDAKKLVVGLPSPLRKGAWRLSQALPHCLR